MKIAVVGATGMVGRVMLKVLEERNFPVSELIPVASEKSLGQIIEFKGKKYPVYSMESAVERQPEIALFSAGGDTSKEWAPKFAELGTSVNNDHATWPQDPRITLIVPAIDAHIVTSETQRIATPHRSAIQLVMVSHRLHQKHAISRLVVSTYQAVTVTGKAPA